MQIHWYEFEIDISICNSCRFAFWIHLSVLNITGYDYVIIHLGGVFNSGGSVCGSAKE